MTRLTISSLATSLLALGSVAHAGPIAPDPYSGFGFDVNYCELNGLWNDGNEWGPGLGLDWFATPVSAPSNPWQQVSIDASSGTFEANGNECSGYPSAAPWDTLTLDTYGSITPITFSPFGGFQGTNGSTTTWRAGNLQIHKHEYWGAADRERYPEGIEMAAKGQALIIDITVTNMGCEAEEFVLMHGVDPDQDVVATGGDHTTCNDTTDTQNLALSQGPKTGIVTAYGRCDEEKQSLGHTVWDPSASAAFNDENWTRNDYTQHINHKDFVEAQQSVNFKFIFVTAPDLTTAVDTYYNTRSEVCCNPNEEAHKKDLEYVKGLKACYDLEIKSMEIAPDNKEFAVK